MATKLTAPLNRGGMREKLIERYLFRDDVEVKRRGCMSEFAGVATEDSCMCVFKHSVGDKQAAGCKKSEEGPGEIPIKIVAAAQGWVLEIVGKPPRRASGYYRLFYCRPY